MYFTKKSLFVAVEYIAKCGRVQVGLYVCYCCIIAPGLTMGVNIVILVGSPWLHTRHSLRRLSRAKGLAGSDNLPVDLTQWRETMVSQ